MAFKAEYEPSTTNTDDKPKRPFAHLPNQVVRDKRLSPEALAYLAFRATFANDKRPFATHPTTLRKLGMGKNVAERAIRQTRTTGYIKRWQPASGVDGKFLRAKEVLALPDTGKKGKRRFFSRKWLEGDCTTKEFGALMYLRAGKVSNNGKECRELFSHEIADRFDWSTPTVLKVLKGLLDKNLIVKTVDRNKHGQVQRVTYFVPRLSRDALHRSVREQDASCGQPADHYAGRKAAKVAASQPQSDAATNKKPGNGSPGHGSPEHGFPGAFTYLPSEEDSLTDSSSESLTDSEEREPERTLRECCDFRASPETSPHEQNFEALIAEAQSDPRLLEWSETFDDVVQGIFADGPEPEALDAVRALVPDHELKQLLKQASGGRIGRHLFTPAALAAWRWVAAVASQDRESTTFDAEAGLRLVLNAIKARIGNRAGEWLNSISVIGIRLSGALHNGGEPFSMLRTLITNDGAKALSPKLRADKHGLAEFVERQTSQHGIGAGEIEGIMLTILRRAMIDGGRAGSIKSWRYFERAIIEEAHRSGAVDHSIRPGDVFGARQGGLH